MSSPRLQRLPICAVALALWVPTAAHAGPSAEEVAGLERRQGVDALGGAILSRQTAARFDWDQQRQADHVLESASDPALLSPIEAASAATVASSSSSDADWQANPCQVLYLKPAGVAQ